MGNVLQCIQPVKIVYERKTEWQLYTLILSETQITPSFSRVVDETSEDARSRPDSDFIKDTRYSCPLDRKHANPGMAPFVMGIIVAGLATAGLFSLAWGLHTSNEYETV